MAGTVTGGGLTYTVVANQTATFTGSDQLEYDLQQIPNQDDFDGWAFGRDQREDDADSANYVSREMTGYEDLDTTATGVMWPAMDVLASARRRRGLALIATGTGPCRPLAGHG